MTDILIPLGTGSRHNNLELRFCLRSIEKHLKGIGNIYIVGEKPDFLKNIIHIPFEESSDNNQRANNIYRKILAGCDYHDYIEEKYNYSQFPTIIRDTCLSDNFLFMNDDHFLLQDYEAGEFPYYHRGAIVLNDFVSNQPQYKQYQNTIRKRFGSDYYDFDVHSPIVLNKKKFIEVFKDLQWPEYGYAIKTMYSNEMIDRTNWIMCEDLKFKERVFMKESVYRSLEGRSWWSIGDRCLLVGSKIKEVLEELYSKPSKYEL